MNNKERIPRSPNVTAKHLLTSAIVVGAMLILVWYKETGSRIAALIFAIIPIVGLLFYLKMRSEDRKRAGGNS